MLNGPARWPKLEGLFANQENWRNRIRSVDVGPAATVTVYTDAAFQGASRRLAPNSKHPRLDSELAARIESFGLACPDKTPVKHSAADDGAGDERSDRRRDRVA